MIRGLCQCFNEYRSDKFQHPQRLFNSAVSHTSMTYIIWRTAYCYFRKLLQKRQKDIYNTKIDFLPASCTSADLVQETIGCISTARDPKLGIHSCNINA